MNFWKLIGKDLSEKLQIKQCASSFQQDIKYLFPHFDSIYFILINQVMYLPKNKFRDVSI